MKLTLLCLFQVQFSQLGKSLPVSWRNNAHHHDGSASHPERKYEGQGKQDPCHVFSFKCPASIALAEQGKSWGSSLMSELKTRNLSVQIDLNCDLMLYSHLLEHTVWRNGGKCTDQHTPHTTPSPPRRELEGHQLLMLISDFPSHHGPAWWSLDYVWLLLIQPVLILTWGLFYVLDIGPALLPCLPDNLGSGLHSHACLPCSLAGGWWDRPWLARPYPAGHSIPPSSQILSLMEQLALMSQKKNPTCEHIQDTKTISKKKFVLYLP